MKEEKKKGGGVVGIVVPAPRVVLHKHILGTGNLTCSLIKQFLNHTNHHKYTMVS